MTRGFKQTVAERVKRDPKYAKALLDEAVSLFLNGEPEAARLILRDLVNATVGFERPCCQDEQAGEEPAPDAVAAGQPEHG